VAVKARFKSEGSVLRETVQAAGLGFETQCDLESTDPTDKVAAVVRNAESGCYVLQSILNPVPVQRKFMLNGSEFDPETFRKK
jgi:hypothetical protein